MKTAHHSDPQSLRWHLQMSCFVPTVPKIFSLQLYKAEKNHKIRCAKKKTIYTGLWTVNAAKWNKKLERLS